MADSAEYVFFNGELTQKQDAKIPVGNAGLFYGAGCFETFSADQNRIFNYSAHIERLNKGLQYLGVAENHLPDKSDIRDHITELIQKNGLNDSRAKIRIQVSMMDEGGYQVNQNIPPVIYITALAQKEVKKELTLKTVNTRVVPASAKPSKFKLSNMLHYRKASQEAREDGFDDGLMVTTTNDIAETSISNLFWVSGNNVYTPSDDCDILPGIMRHAVIDVITSLNDYSINLGNYELSEINKAEAVWCTNSVMKIVPVSKIDGHSYDVNHPIFESLRHTLNNYIIESFE